MKNEINEDKVKLVEASQKLQEIALTLRKWARESIEGGWSTHQLKPQRELSFEIEDLLDQIGRF